MSSSTIDPGDKSPAEIEEDVERTRARVSGTLDSLREKLAPSQMIDEVIDRVSEFARGSGGTTFARNLGGAVRDNPLPILLIGAGIGWLMLSGGQSASSDPDRTRLLLSPPRRPSDAASDRASMMDDAVGKAGEVAEAVGDAATRARSYVGDAATRASSYVSDAASRVADAGSNLVGNARDGRRMAAQKAEAGWSSASDLMDAQPLLTGLLGVVVGAALGAVLPRTQMEDELLGEAADAATTRVSQFGRETVEHVRAAAGEHLDEVKNAASEGFSKVKERLDEGSLPAVGEALGEALDTTAKAVGSAATGLAGEVKQRMEKDGQPQNHGQTA